MSVEDDDFQLLWWRNPLARQEGAATSKKRVSNVASRSGKRSRNKIESSQSDLKLKKKVVESSRSAISSRHIELSQSVRNVKESESLVEKQVEICIGTGKENQYCGDSGSLVEKQVEICIGTGGSEQQQKRGKCSGFGSPMETLIKLCGSDDEELEEDPAFGEKEPVKGKEISEEEADIHEEEPVVEVPDVDDISALMTQKITEPIQDEGSPLNMDTVEDLEIFCPICGTDVGGLALQEREKHTNSCLDEPQTKEQVFRDVSNSVDTNPVVKFLENLNLERFVPLFVKQEIDWDTLQWLTDDDLSTLGISTFGPRKKILVALQELKLGASCSNHDENADPGVFSVKKYITDFFGDTKSRTHRPVERKGDFGLKHPGASIKKPKKTFGLQKTSGLPPWKSVPGTKFRVDAFQYLTNDCSHWFLTHFHSDHYQGLTKGFRYGKIYCSLITARLVNLRIGIPWDRLHCLQLNERTNIDGEWVTALDANHCPGATMFLFEPRNSGVVLHSGDFRYCDEMAKVIPRSVNTLVLDTTYCNPQYDFPKQETVIQFVIDAIQAESFNPNTLFLIGTYTLGKERLFLEVARVLRRKIYVGAVKRRMLGCLDLSDENMRWITTNDKESCIHVVPLWSIASFKRMTSISRHYNGRYNTIVSFSPTGWTSGRGKKRTPGKRWQQGTIVRYEVPYSEHSSFSELKTFVKLVSPERIIPSVNNTSADAATSMIKSLLSG